MLNAVKSLPVVSFKGDCGCNSSHVVPASGDFGITSAAMESIQKHFDNSPEVNQVTNLSQVCKSLKNEMVSQPPGENLMLDRGPDADTFTLNVKVNDHTYPIEGIYSFDQLVANPKQFLQQVKSKLNKLIINNSKELETQSQLGYLKEKYVQKSHHV